MKTISVSFHQVRVFWGLVCILSMSNCSSDADRRQRVAYDAETLPVVILGGGVAGLTAAIYLTQANIPVVVVEGPKPGGALSQSQGVRNWPGEYNVPGAEIVQKIKKHAIACGAQILQARVTAVNLYQTPFTFDLEPMAGGQKTTVKVASCIVAMGTEPNFLNVPGERGEGGPALRSHERSEGEVGYWGRGVSNCAVCDGFFFKGKHVVVVGGGDAAVEEASYLAGLAADVTVLIRKEIFRAKDIKARDRLVVRSNVKILFNTRITQILGDGKKVTDVQVQNTKTGEQHTLSTDGVFLAIGSRPNTDLLKGQLELDDRGFVVLKHHQAASVPGVFAAGDVSDPHFVQAITAAGDGCRAALQVKKYLEEVGLEQHPVSLRSGHESARVSKGEVPRGPVEIESEQQFEEVVVHAKQPVFLDMYAHWCLPCQRMMPIVDKLAKEFGSQTLFAKLNVAKKEIDIERLMRMIHGKAVYSVPTFIIVQDGQEVKHIEGSRDYDALKKMLAAMFEHSENLAFVR